MSVCERTRVHESLLWVSVSVCCDRACLCTVGSDRERWQLDIHTLPIPGGPRLAPAWPPPGPGPGSDSQRIWELLRRRHPAPRSHPDRPAGGEETGAFRGSRGPNSVTRSLHSFSTVNPNCGWAGAPPPAGCGERLRERALVLEDWSEGPQPCLQGALLREPMLLPSPEAPKDTDEGTEAGSQPPLAPCSHWLLPRSLLPAPLGWHSVRTGHSCL